MKQEEQFIMDWAGKVLEGVGISGAVFTLFFDQIARGAPVQYGWLQILGIIMFIALALFGVMVDSFLRTVKELLK